MTFRYDQTVDALYIGLQEGADVSRTEHIEPGTLVDLDRHGHAVGIELLRPARAWPLDEIADRFHVNDGDRDVLRSLWSDDTTFPYAQPLELVAAAG